MINKKLEFKVLVMDLDILEKVGGIELDAARRVAGSGFYYLDRRYCKTTFSNINICKRKRLLIALSVM